MSDVVKEAREWLESPDAFDDLADVVALVEVLIAEIERMEELLRWEGLV